MATGGFAQLSQKEDRAFSGLTGQWGILELGATGTTGTRMRHTGSSIRGLSSSRIGCSRSEAGGPGLDSRRRNIVDEEAQCDAAYGSLIRYTAMQLGCDEGLCWSKALHVALQELLRKSEHDTVMAVVYGCGPSSQGPGTAGRSNVRCKPHCRPTAVLWSSVTVEGGPRSGP